MAKKKIDIFIEIDSAKQFEKVLKVHKDTLICAEIYCEFAGYCNALQRLFTDLKLNWSDGQIVLLKVKADDIEDLKRFRDHSEPVFLFILDHKVTKIFRGVDNIKFTEVAKQELFFYKKHKEGNELDRVTYRIDEVTPGEEDWFSSIQQERDKEKAALSNIRAIRQAERKRNRADLMAEHLSNLNFVIFWPHARHAHVELYERWDMNNIIMVGREDIELTLETAKDILYAGDAPLNEASMQALLAGPALAICFRILDTDKDFVALVRHILYEYIPPLDDSCAKDDQPPQKTAFNLYKSYSLSREAILRKRLEEKQKQKEELIEKRARRLSEMQRLARQAIAEQMELNKQKKEEKKLELLKTGKIDELEKLKKEPEEEVDIVIPEELPEDMVEEEQSEEEDDENEYFPPAGLVIPAFYAPPNEIAKANGLALLFPRLVLEHVTPIPEFLPPHLMVSLEIDKRHKAIKALAGKYWKAIINMGIFRGDIPYGAKLIAKTIKEYDQMNLENDLTTHLAFMVSAESELTLLQLVELKPEYVSRDTDSGEEECAAMFPQGDADCGQLSDDFSDD